jgi:hypothetical protein
MTQPVFRERAIKAYVDPDARTPLLPLARPRAAGFLLAVALLTLGGLALSAFLRVHVVARGRGVIRPRAGVLTVRAPRSGVVHDLAARPGELLSDGATLLSLGEPVVVPHGGVLDVLSVHDGEYVVEGSVLARVVPAGDEVGFVAVPARFRSSLHVDQSVRVSIDEYPSDEMGFARGRVSRIGADLLSQELLAEELSLSGLDAHEGPWVLVELALDRPPPRSSGGFRNGMTIDGVIPLRTRPVLAVLFPPLAEWLD